MTVSEKIRLNISLCLSIALAICQVLTVAALIILFKVYSDLKKKFTGCQKNLSLIEAALEAETKRDWHKDGEDIPTRVPTPPSNRRSGYKQQDTRHKDGEDSSSIVGTRLPSNYRRSGYKQETSHRTQSNSSQEMMGFPRDTSFTSARSRDSGTGSITTRTPQSSISFKSRLQREDPLIEGESKHLEGRSMSWNEPKNQNEETDSRSSRLQTMAIGMIGMEEYDGRKNEGYHNDNEECNDDLSPRSAHQKPTLDSEKLVRDMNSESEQIRKDGMKKKWHKNEEEIPTRVPTPPSNRRWKRNQNEETDSRSSRLQTMAIGMIGIEENDSLENERWHKDGEEYPASCRFTTHSSNTGLKINQNELENSHSSRLQTMAIEMIGVEENGLAGGLKNKRTSTKFNQRKETSEDEVPSYLDDNEYVDTQL